MYYRVAYYYVKNEKATASSASMLVTPLYYLCDHEIHHGVGQSTPENHAHGFQCICVPHSHKTEMLVSH